QIKRGYGCHLPNIIFKEIRRRAAPKIFSSVVFERFVVIFAPARPPIKERLYLSGLAPGEQ
ncbi:MAG TPA: hypothetical protein VFG29_02025, partial [Syntrophales bacterium]|nr:hypothetical protein [Syntrophales bacterium]